MGPSPSQERVLIHQAQASEASCCGIEAHRTREPFYDLRTSGRSRFYARKDGFI